VEREAFVLRIREEGGLRLQELILTVNDHLRFRGVVYGPGGALTVWTLDFENMGKHELAEMLHFSKWQSSDVGQSIEGLRNSCEVIVPERVRKTKNPDYRTISYVPWEIIQEWAKSVYQQQSKA